MTAALKIAPEAGLISLMTLALIALCAAFGVR